MKNFAKMRELRGRGLSYSAIGRELGVSRKTVAQYLKSNVPPRYGPREVKTKEDHFGEFESMVRNQIREVPRWTAAEIFEWIAARGYKGSQRTVARRLQVIKGEKAKERFFEQVYEPGKQAQFDFKESVILPFSSGGQRVHIHVSTLPYSDKGALKAYPNKTYECYIDGIHSFFEKIGGMTIEIRIDNLSPAVKKVLLGSQRIYTDSFQKAIAYYGFNVSPCTPGKGNEKGDVERDIQTYTRRFLNHVKVEGIIFRDFEHLNEILETFGEKFADQEKFLEEKKKLLPLPPRDENILSRIEEHPASSHGLVRFQKSCYSVPDEVIGVSCKVIAGPYSIKIIRGDTRAAVATHARVQDGQHSISIAHVISSLMRKPNAMVNWSHKEILFPSPVFKKYYDYLKSDSDILNPHSEFLRAINLIQHTSLADIGTGMELILQAHTIKPSKALSELKEILINEHRPTNILDVSERFGQEPIKPNLLIYDNLIPEGGAANL